MGRPAVDGISRLVERRDAADRASRGGASSSGSAPCGQGLSHHRRDYQDGRANRGLENRAPSDLPSRHPCLWRREQLGLVVRTLALPGPLVAARIEGGFREFRRTRPLPAEAWPRGLGQDQGPARETVRLADLERGPSRQCPSPAQEAPPVRGTARPQLVDQDGPNPNRKLPPARLPCTDPQGDRPWGQGARVLYGHRRRRRLGVPKSGSLFPPAGVT